MANGCSEPSTAAAVHDALCGSTATTTRSSDILVTTTGTNLSLPRHNSKARRAHQLSATQASLQPLPAGSAVTGPASQYGVSQQATGIERATPDHRLEEHGCRPRPPGYIQQVGIEPVSTCGDADRFTTAVRGHSMEHNGLYY